MSYTRSIPQPTDLISNSQAQILGNFQAIDSGTTGTGAGFSRNHVTLTDGTNGGLHNRVDFYQVISDPSVTGFVASLYPKTVGATQELFRANTAGVMQIGGALNSAHSGYCYLFGGILMQWGTAGVSDTNTVNFPIGFPNNQFTCITSPVNSSGPPNVPDVAAYNVTNSNFQVHVSQNGSAGSTTINFVAFGN